MPTIHPTALVDPRAQLAADVEVGPYTLIGEHVVIGAGTRIGAHNVITGHTRIGANNHIFHFTSIGEANQDKKYRGEPTTCVIGDGNTIREYVSINRGTVQDRSETTVGNDNWLMAHVHVAHDCQVGDHTVFANHATLAGHVSVGDYTILGGFVGVHQFCKVGAHVMAGVSAVILQDVPTYLMVTGNPAIPRSINSEGLRRRGFSDAALAGLKRAYRLLYRDGLRLEEAKAKLQELATEVPEVSPLLAFLATATRGIVR
jgi:UDP-N-acetylglucosamine acyltransferase